MSDEILRRLDSIDAKLDQLFKAFPNGDLIAHASHHSEEMSNRATQQRMKLAAIEQIIKGSVWALLVAAAIGLWTFAREHMK